MYGNFVFDSDSRLVKIDGINRLAEWAGMGEEVAGLAQAAMGEEDTPLSPVSVSAELGVQGIAALGWP